jgi:hypothetical protein
MNPQESGYPNPQNPANPGETPPPIHNPLAVMQPGEQTLCEIKRHPIGMFGVYTLSGIVLIGLAVAIFGLAPKYLTNFTSGQIIGVGGLFYAIVALFVFMFVFVANKVYWGNRWIITSDSITQVTQTSLFDKQTSQLSLGNLEDVTVEQDGLLPHLYNYGLLRCETAGERSKFVFLFCPNPNYYAKQILGAREQFEQGRRGGDEQRLYREQNAYPQQPQPNPMPPTYGGGGNDDHGVNINV